MDWFLILNVAIGVVLGLALLANLIFACVALGADVGGLGLLSATVAVATLFGVIWKATCWMGFEPICNLSLAWS